MSIDFYSKIEYNLENRSNKEGRRIQKIRDNDRQSAHGKENEKVKRYLCLVIAALLALSGMSAMAELAAEGTEHSFDHSVWEGLDGYSEDKFDKTWKYQIKVYNPQEVDLALVLTIQGKLADSKIEDITLFTVDMDNAAPAEKLQVLIGETVYTFDFSEMLEQLGLSALMLSNGNSSFFEALANAEEVSLRASFDGTSYDVVYSSNNEKFKAMQSALQEFFRQGGTDCYSADAVDMCTTLEELQLQVMTVE